MTARDARSVLADPALTGRVDVILAALAAAAADGPLTAEVECPRCEGEGMPCAVCGDTGTVRVVVHLADPTLAEELQRSADSWDPVKPRTGRMFTPIKAIRAAARIVGGDTDA